MVNRRQFLKTMGIASASLAGSQLLGRLGGQRALAGPPAGFRGFVNVFATQQMSSFNIRMVPPGEDRSTYDLERYNFRDFTRTPSNIEYALDLSDSRLEWSEPLRAVVEDIGLPPRYLTVVDGVSQVGSLFDRTFFGDPATSHILSRASSHTGGYGRSELGTSSFPSIDARINAFLSHQLGRTLPILNFDGLESRGTNSLHHHFFHPIEDFDPNDGVREFSLSEISQPGFQDVGQIWQTYFRDFVYPDMDEDAPVDPVLEGRPDALAQSIARHEAMMSQLSSEEDRRRLERQIARLRALASGIDSGAMASRLCVDPARPPTPYDGSTALDEARAIARMIAMGFLCDINRVANLALRMPNGGRLRDGGDSEEFGEYRFHFANGDTFDINRDLHNVFAHQSDPQRQHGLSGTNIAAANAAIGAYNRNTLEFAAMIAKELYDTPDEATGGNLLDGTLIVVTSELCDGAHGFESRAVVILGNAPGLQTGYYYSPAVNHFRPWLNPGGEVVRSTNYKDYGPRYTLSQLYITLMQSYGMTIDQIGEPTYVSPHDLDGEPRETVRTGVIDMIRSAG